MSEIIDISVGLTEERVEINATPNVIEVNIVTGSAINPASYDLADFTNTSVNPFVQYNALSAYTPTSRLLTINGITQDLSTDRSWTLPIPSITGLVPYIGATQDLELGANELYTGKLWLYDSVNDNYGSVHFTDTDFHIEDADGHKMLVIEDGFMQIHKTDTIQSNLFTSGLTATRNHYLPDASGTIALTSDLSAYVPTTRTISTTAPLSGGGDLSANRTLSIPKATTLVDGYLSSADWNTFNGKQSAISLTTTGTGAATFVSNVLNIPTPAAATFSSLTTTGSSGASTLTSGVLNVPTYSLSGLGGVPTSRTLTINGTTQDLSADRTFTISTGITIGTTAITSGTVGRVLFQGTGNVVQQSADLFWNNTSGRLGIGTASPLSKLHIGGVGSSISFDTTGELSANLIRTINDFELSLLCGRGTTTEAIVGGSNFKILTSAIERLRIVPNGNVLINTTTDAGFKLDVNGTARVSDNLLLTNGIIATSAATTRLQGSLNYFTHNRIGSSGALGFKIAVSGTDVSFWRRDDGSGDVEFGNATIYGLSLLTNNTSKVYIASGGQVGIGTTAPNANALLDLTSTTRGFLPPRMTTTQRDAIASPATGLEIYNTTTNTNDNYNGTAWVSEVNGTGSAGQVAYWNGANSQVGSSNLFWDNTNGRLGIGTSSPSAIIHSVGSVTASGAIARGNYLNNTLVASANSDVLVGLDVQPTFTNGAFTGVANLAIRASTTSTSAIGKLLIGTTSNPYGVGSLVVEHPTSFVTWFKRGANMLEINPSSGGVNIITSTVDTGGTQLPLSLSARKINADLYLQTTGNIGIGTTTDAGFKLDVNGTARVVNLLTGTGGLTISGSNTGISTSTTFINNISMTTSGFGTTGYGMAIDGGFRWGINAGNSYKFGHWAGLNGAYNWNNTSASVIEVGMGATTPNVNNITWTSVNITPTFNADFSSRSGNLIRGVYYNPTITSLVNGVRNQLRAFESSFGGAYFNTTSVDGSAILQADSTTQGFLPPRMTTTQKNAIASPAAGLVVYDTDLNALCTYNGTTWTTLGSGGGASSGSGIHVLTKPITGFYYSQITITGTSVLGSGAFQQNGSLQLFAFVPANTVTCDLMQFEIVTAAASALSKIAIYSDVAGKPSAKLYESPDTDSSTTGYKTVTTSFTFTGGTAYWIGLVSNSSSVQPRSIPSANFQPLVYQNGTNQSYNGWYISAAYGSLPATATVTPSNVNMSSVPYISFRQA